MTRIVWAGGPAGGSVSEDIARGRRVRRRNAATDERHGPDVRSALRTLVGIVALAAIAVAGVSLRVREVRVHGAIMADLQALRDNLEPMLGERLLLLDTRALQHRLEADAWVQHASIARALPGRIEVSVREGEPCYRLPDGRGLVDEHGRVLPLRDGIAASGLPLLHDVAWTEDGSLDAASVARLRELSKALRSVAWTWPAGLADVRLLGEDGVELLTADGLRLILGETDFERRLTRFAAVHPHLRPLESGRVDLRFGRQVVLVPEPSSTEPTGG
jgi:cell division septal protein FtsQ